MSSFSRRALFWAPRVLSLAVIAFLSLFALDVFGGNLGFWQTALALIMHLIPVFVLIAALILAWRWEWIGAAIYRPPGCCTSHGPCLHRAPFPRRQIDLDSGYCRPALAIAVLFLVNWLKRGELHAPKR